jgi:two-component system response regulator BaeR
LSHHVLIVEDEPKLAALLADYLREGGYTTQRLEAGDAVAAAVAERMPDLVLLDLNLPGLDGLEVCRALRQTTDLPVIMVTARIDELDRLIGLEAGADDYICKPFSPREVVARVKAVLRRSGKEPPSPHANDLVLDPASHRALLKGADLHLSAIEYRLLEVLHAAPGRIFSRSQLIDAMYTDHRVVSDRTVDSHVKKVRRKLKDAAPELEFLHSVYGLGYRFET